LQYIKIKDALNSKMALFTFFASFASILSLFGWAAEHFLGYAPKTLGIISFIVIGLIFIVACYLLITAFFQYTKIKNIQGDYVLSHRISHHLRNSIATLQSLEFQTIKKVRTATSVQQLSDIKENDELKRRDTFKKLGAKTTGAVAQQLANYFLCNGLEGNIRVTIKSILPNGNNQLDWEVSTAVVDPVTWNDQDRIIEEKEDEHHKIGENSDFKGILLGDEKYFYSNDLSALPDEKYQNSSKNWRARYNATMVVPIKNQPDGKRNTVYYGFLTADSLNAKKQELFISGNESAPLNILAHAADTLAVWFIKNDNHAEMLFNESIEKTNEIEKVNQSEGSEKNEVNA